MGFFRPPSLEAAQTAFERLQSEHPAIVQWVQANRPIEPQILQDDEIAGYVRVGWILRTGPVDRRIYRVVVPFTSRHGWDAVAGEVFRVEDPEIYNLAAEIEHSVQTLAEGLRAPLEMLVPFNAGSDMLQDPPYASGQIEGRIQRRTRTPRMGKALCIETTPERPPVTRTRWDVLMADDEPV